VPFMLLVGVSFLKQHLTTKVMGYYDFRSQYVAGLSQISLSALELGRGD
jgi:hypothetical protein